MRWSRKLPPPVLVAAAALVAGAWGAVELGRWRQTRAKAGRVEGYRDLVWRHARRQALPTELVEAVILHESGGDPRAVSDRGARGLMQITPIAEREVLRRTPMAGGDLFDPDYNLAVGTAYLRMMLDRFDGDLHLALAAYHAGPTRIAALRRRHPELDGRTLVERHAPRSTAAYCRKVLAR